MQSLLGNVLIQDDFLKAEALKMLKMALRLAKCFVEYVRTSEHENGKFKALFSCIIMQRSIETLMWENSPYVCQQIKGIHPYEAITLHKNGYSTFKSILKSTSWEIESVCGPQSIPNFYENNFVLCDSYNILILFIEDFEKTATVWK